MRNEHCSDEMLLRHVDGELEPAARSVFERHIETCAACQDRLRSIGDVSDALEDFSDSLADSRPPAFARARLIRAMAHTSPALERRKPARSPARMAFAFAADVFLLIGIATLIRQPPAVIPQPKPSFTGFIALPYSDNNLAPEGGVVLQVELPRSALLLAGVPAAAAAGGRVKAEIMVGADGLARAIRFQN
jgi:anti-sigma factor RsiW